MNHDNITSEIIKLLPIQDVGQLLREAQSTLEQNQEVINILATEIARRLYTGNPAITFEEFRANYGYKIPKEEKIKIMIKRIDLYEE